MINQLFEFIRNYNLFITLIKLYFKMLTIKRCQNFHVCIYIFFHPKSVYLDIFELLDIVTKIMIKIG